MDPNAPYRNEDLSFQEWCTVMMKRKHMPLHKLGKAMGLTQSSIHGRISGYVPISEEEIKKIKELLG